MTIGSEDAVAAPDRSLGRLGPSSRGALRWWAAGTAVGLLVVGPSWTGEALLNLDLVVFDRIGLSAGFWGLGPELPRQAPAVAALAIASTVLDGTTLVTAFVIACVAAAFVGVERLSRPAPWTARAAAGVLYALSPWLLTRIAVGHLGLVLAAAALPWVLPTLLRPEADLRRTFLASAALGLAGYFGGTLGLVVIAVGVVAGRGRRAGWVAGVWALGQLPWLVPGLIVGLSTPDVAGGDLFATRLASAGDYGRLLLGYGFWQRTNQLALNTPVTPIAALLVLAVAVAGASALPRPWGRRAAALAGVGLVLAAIGSLPLLGAVFDRLSTSLPFAAFRESQRALVLFLVWLAPAMAHGIGRIQRHDARSGVLAAFGCAMIAVVTVNPALWGLDGRFDSVDVPESWGVVRERVETAPGTVVALPWTLYFDLDVADGRRTHHPIPLYLRGDVLNSSDLELASDRDAALDPRERAVDGALAALDAGRPIADRLADLGVRWLVVVTGVDDDRYGRLRLDTGLQVVVDDESIVLYEVRAWAGRAVDGAGVAVPVDQLIPPVVRVGDAATVWYAPYAPGWVRGFDGTSRSPLGAIELPADSGPVWYWPALIVLVGHALTAAAVVAALLLPAENRERVRSLASRLRPR